jgi:predicted PurR-regulated permease PerM
LVQVPITLSTSLVEFFLIVFMSLYLVILTPGIRQFFLSLFPEGRRERVGQVASHVVGAMGGYVRGSLISGLIIGVITYFGLLLIGVEFPLVLAIIAGLFELLPIIGPYMSGAIMTAVALLGGVTQALITLGFAIVLQQVESNLIIPNVMSAEAEISPLMTILAITAGAGVGGIIGALVAVPIAAALHVLVVEVVAPAMRRQTGAEPWVSPVEEVKGDER